MARLLFLFTFLIFSAAVPAQAGVNLSPEQQELAEKLRQYLNGMRTLTGKFAQISTTGEYADGSVVLQRPGKMRLVYNPPLQQEIIVRNGTIIYHDLEFKQVTYYPLNATPLGVLLQDELSFEKDVEIIDIARERGVIEMTLVDRDDPAMGSVTLVFSDAPLALRKWAIVDAQGIMTQVSLLNPVIGQPVDSENFKFIDPQYNKTDD